MCILPAKLSFKYTCSSRLRHTSRICLSQMCVLGMYYSCLHVFKYRNTALAINARTIFIFMLEYQSRLRLVRIAHRLKLSRLYAGRIFTPSLLDSFLVQIMYNRASLAFWEAILRIGQHGSVHQSSRAKR
jgi:hypothetical protein